MSSYQYSDSIPGINAAQFTFSYAHRDEVSMDLDSEWMSNVDPQLRNAAQWNDQPLQRFLGEPQKNLFTTRPYSQYDSFQQGLHTGPSPSLPYVYKRQIYSPAPSSQERYSIGSSALSPNSADNDWTNSQQTDGIYQTFGSSPLSRSTSHNSNSQGVPELIWPAKSFSHQDAVPCGVSLSQLQGIPDESDIIYQEDEGFMETMETKTEFQEMQTRNQQLIKQELPYPTHRQSIDEGLGHSIKDESSPSRRSSYQPITNDSDIDAEGESESPSFFEPEQEDDEDEEYRPRGHISSSTSHNGRRRRRATTKTSPTSPIHSSKRSKITKSATLPSSKRTNPPFQCPSCTKNSFPNAAALQKHINSIHTRAFICTFSFAGCTSRFASKNEWKRHVSSQHLCLNYWLCDVGVCSKKSTSSTPNQTHTLSANESSTKSNEFNRKDLFTQHLRRMHAPFAVKRQGRKLESWEDRVRELQVSGLRVRREAPERTGCVVGGCEGVVFEGKGSWDERMEHAAKHLERGEGVEEGVDDGLLEWSLREGVVEQAPNGGWRLCSSSDRGVAPRVNAKRESFEDDEEEDAEGEDDV